MKKLLLGMTAMMVMAVVAAPSASAQEAEKADAEKKMEKMEKMEGEAKDVHWMKGTMTGPDSEPENVKYAFKKTDDGAKGWIVAQNDEGETVKMEMRDLSWDDDTVTYNWSPPDRDDLVISCSLHTQDDGGYGGTCTDNQEESRTGQMTIAPMENEESR